MKIALPGFFLAAAAIRFANGIGQLLASSAARVSVDDVFPSPPFKAACSCGNGFEPAGGRSFRHSAASAAGAGKDERGPIFDGRRPRRRRLRIHRRSRGRPHRLIKINSAMRPRNIGAACGLRYNSSWA